MAIFTKRDDIVIKYGADDTRFQKVTKRVKATGKDVAGYFGSIGKTISGFFSRNLASTITAVATAMAGLTKNALNSADALAKTADKVGIGIENLQRLRYAADANGVSQNTLDMAMQRFSRRVAEAAHGTGVLYKELDQLGIQVRDSQGRMRTTTDILLDYADAVANAESKQEQLRLSFAAFDSEGAALVNMLRQGKIGLEEMMQVADELGVIIDENTVRASERLNQAWNDMTARWGTYWKKTLLGMATALDKLAGNYRTLQNAEERLVEVNKEIEEIERNRVDSASRLYDTQNRRIRQLREERAALKQKADALRIIEQAEKDAAAATAGAAQSTAAGGGGTKTTKSPELTYHQQNMQDFAAYRSGDITRDEWLKRERERNPFVNPESPYAKEFNVTSGPTTGTGSASITRVIGDAMEGQITVIAQGIVMELDKQLDEIIGKERVAPVRAELINDGADSIRQAADQEGETTGPYTGGYF